MTNPYKQAPASAFWKRAVSSNWEPRLVPRARLLEQGEKLASAGSCFAANIVPHIEAAGFEYVRTEKPCAAFGELARDNFSYSKFSAAYGNIYTARQACQLLLRAMGRFRPAEDCWVVAEDSLVDPFRPGLRHPASSRIEFDALTRQHLAAVLEAVRCADVFVFTLGLTEAWISSLDGAVFPACPGTIAGSFDASRHVFHNFSVDEVRQDLSALARLLREVQPRIRLILTVSPVPLVATATAEHVLTATVYSKSVLRVAAAEAAANLADVHYFPAYELVTGPQAPERFFQDDRREPSDEAIATVMDAFLAHCGCDRTVSASPSAGGATPARAVAAPPADPPGGGDAFASELSRIVSAAECEEAAAGL